MWDRTLSVICGLVVACIVFTPLVRAEDPAGASAGVRADEPEASADPPDESSPPDDHDDGFEPIEWGPKGLDIRSRDDNYHAHIDWRAQVRFTESTFGEKGLAPNPETREGQFGSTAPASRWVGTRTAPGSSTTSSSTS